mmetsp:Transcript_5811/g.8543  ORF Transcript_5811/g.8543 Transcript_5811/m.8543 type:complete len:226 (-) Transcript_5811:163-840(-)
MIIIDSLVYYASRIGCWMDTKWQALFFSSNELISTRVEESDDQIKEKTRIPSEDVDYIKNKHIKHIAFYIDEDFVDDMMDHHTIEALIAWCREWNIEHITLFDIKGLLKKTLEPYNNPHVCFHSEESYGPSMVAKFYNEHYDTLKLSKSTEDVNNTLSSIYQEHYKIPEPELLIVVSPLFSVHGFSPYHLRYTELRHLSDWKHLTKPVLCKIIYTYCQIVHRKGK